MCQYWLINYEKFATLMQNVIIGEMYEWMGGGIWKLSVLPAHFSVNLNLFKNNLVKKIIC